MFSHNLLNHHQIPATRSALTEITPNYKRGFELSPYERGIIIRKSLLGMQSLEIAEAENMPVQTVQNIL